jgi:uncharacterized membrane protein
LFFSRHSLKIVHGRFGGEASGGRHYHDALDEVARARGGGGLDDLCGDTGPCGFFRLNKSSYKIFVAFGYWDASQKAWTSEGWWTLEKGDCQIVYKPNLDQEKYYVYAESTDHDYTWAGKYPFCASDDEFTIVGDSECKSRGYYAVDFFEVEVGDKRDFVQDLVD